LSLPIGIFDSGLGGLSVAARVIAALPNERVAYFADNAHVPYGERPLDEIREFAVEITRFLIGQGAKAVVMACNMSSAVAIEAARLINPDVPVIGVIEPGARAAVEVAGDSPIGVLATTGTVRSEAYARTIERLAPGSVIVQQACPKFVPLVESGEAESEDAEAAARTYASPLVEAGCKTVILGCTHYPFVRRAIECAVGPSVAIVDPAEETARALEAVLAERGTLSKTAGPNHQFHASGETAGFAALGGRFLGTPIEDVRQAVWGVDLGRKVVA